MLEELTPRQIVAELDRYIIGQNSAKRAVAIALRNRYRRRLLSDDLRNEVIPKNILMIGPTGVGKTEIARRLAHLARAPFIKVEATKFTEVGYVGRDVDSMIRDLVQEAVRIVEREKMDEVQDKASARAVERIVEILQPRPRSKVQQVAGQVGQQAPGHQAGQDDALAAEPVAQVASEAGGDGVNPQERRTQQRKLRRRQVKIRADLRHDGGEDAAVGVVEERNHPEHGDQRPGVAAGTGGGGAAAGRTCDGVVDLARRRWMDDLSVHWGLSSC